MVVRLSPIIIKEYEARDVLNGKSIIVFGAGEDGMAFCNKYCQLLNISFVIDNYKKGMMGKLQIVSFEHAMRLRSDEIILICSHSYAVDIQGQLESAGLIPGEDYYICDVSYTYAVKRFIEWSNSQITSINNREGILLFPLEGCHDGTMVIYKYFLDFLANTNNADAWGYVRNAGNRFESSIFPSVVDMANSIGIKKIVEFQDDEEVDCEAETLLLEISARIQLYDDWNDIVVHGMRVGISLLRDYLRKYKLDFDPKNDDALECIRSNLKTILFWRSFFKHNNVKAVILWDGVHNESFLRDIAIQNGAKTYIVHPKGISRAFLDFSFSENYHMFSEFYSTLSPSEQQSGLKWAKEQINATLSGSAVKRQLYRGDGIDVFSLPRGKYHLESTNKIRVLICPHIFDEDQWLNGEQLCGNNYLSWFLFLRDIINETDYDWYIKLHPDETMRGRDFIDKFINDTPKLKSIPEYISPIDLKEAGFDYALTIAGSIGHEYPALGIEVINAGNNPHISFGFNINPASKGEYEELLLNLKERPRAGNVERIYEYFCLRYLYYKENDYSEEIRGVFNMVNFFERDYEHSLYDAFLNSIEVQPALEDRIREMVAKIIGQMDNRVPGVFYKKDTAVVSKLIRCEI